MQLTSNFGTVLTTHNRKPMSNDSTRKQIVAQQTEANLNKDVFFSGTNDTAKTTDTRSVAKAEAKDSKLAKWGRLGLKYTFKTAFQVLKNCFSLQDLKNGAGHVKQALINIPQQMDAILHHIPDYIQLGWEVAKEHIVPIMIQISHVIGLVIRTVIEHVVGVSFAGSAKHINKPSALTFQGNNLSSLSTNPSQQQQPKAIEPVEFTRTQENALERNLMLAETKFERIANKKFDTPAQRQANIMKYGTDVFNALFNSLDQSQPEFQGTIAKDVHKIVNELNALTAETTQKETFGQLRNETQDRMIDLIKFSLKHPEPLISGFGKDLAQSIGLSQATIQALREE